MKGLMKKLLAVGLLLALALTLGGCGTEPAPDPDDPTPPDPAAKYPATMREFLSSEDTGYCWNDWLVTKTPYHSPAGYASVDVESLFAPYGIVMARLFQDGALAMVHDNANKQDMLQYVKLDGTGRKTGFTVKWRRNYRVGFSASGFDVGECTALMSVFFCSARDSVEQRFIYYYWPSNEVLEFYIDCGDCHHIPSVHPLTNTDFIWTKATDESWKAIAERGGRYTGGYDEIFQYKDGPAVEIYAYSLLTNKSYFLGTSTPGVWWKDSFVNEPMFETWLETYRAQRDEDLAAMEAAQ